MPEDAVAFARVLTGAAPVGRDGLIVALHNPDGSLPYDVRWSDSGRTRLVFPGPDSRVTASSTKRPDGRHRGRRRCSS
ncbi:DUF1918 domain-containing protein [Streptacidiphilus carbonis]|uniref:DUF1918 domain-containing protein n=1 Tax=Streptacidiphilus carbonis TaxID=105422 RepID=UPI000A00BEB4